MENKFLRFVEVDIPNRKTRTFIVKNKTGDRLGTIKYYTGWRKYVFYPEYDTLFDTVCLSDIAKFMEEGI